MLMLGHNAQPAIFHHMRREFCIIKCLLFKKIILARIMFINGTEALTVFIVVLKIGTVFAVPTTIAVTIGTCTIERIPPYVIMVVVQWFVIILL